MKMFTRHVVKQLSAYLNGELSADEARLVREHLLACERCRKDHDEIELGVKLAQQLPMASAPAEMWSEIEALLDARSRKPLPQPKAPRLAFAFSWSQIAAYSAVLVAAVALGLLWTRIYGPRAAWEVANIVGNVRIEGRRVNDIASLAVGDTIETGNSASARIAVGAIGEVDVEPNSRVRLIQAQVTEHRLSLERGKISARISAPPKLFFVNTPSAEAIDLGCAYTLEVDDAGRSFLHVTGGWVALVRDGREVYVPRFAKCQTRPGVGPGTPYFEDAPEALVNALEKFDFENGGEDAFVAVLKESRPRDTFTLWHLLTRLEGDQRARVLDRMIELVGLPKGITREGILALDQKMLEDWKEELIDTVWF